MLQHHPSAQPKRSNLDSYVERFEQHWTPAQKSTGKAELDLQGFLPAEDDPLFTLVATELARIDLEFCWAHGIMREAAYWFERFPKVFQDPQSRSSLAFEQYRQQRSAGHPIDRNSIGHQYGIPTGHWPDLPIGGPGSVDECMKSLQRLSCNSVESIRKLIATLPSAGDHFSGYELAWELGRGTFSRVFAARQQDLANRLVAVKITPQMLDESQKLAKLQNAHIVPIYSAHNHNGLQAICMPLIGSTTMADLIPISTNALEGAGNQLVSTISARRATTMFQLESNDSTEPRAQRVHTFDSNNELSARFDSQSYIDAVLSLLLDATKGLAHAHRRGVVHRDIKPANILISDEGQAMLLDFGLATLVHEVDLRFVGGTLPYMSPQQLESAKTATEASTQDDVFSMGVVIFQMLTGQLHYPSPFSFNIDDISALAAFRRQSPPMLTQANSHISPGLSNIIRRCLAAEPGDRYQNGVELAEDLENHLMHRVLKYAPDTSKLERVHKFRKRHPKLMSLASVTAAVSIVTIASVLLLWMGHERLLNAYASSAFYDFQETQADALIELGNPDRDPQVLRNGIDKGKVFIAKWNAMRSDWMDQSPVSRLPASMQSKLSQDLSRMLYLMAGANADLAIQNDDQLTASRHYNEAKQWNLRSGELYEAFLGIATAQRQRLEQLQDNNSSAAEATESYAETIHRTIRVWGTTRWEHPALQFSRGAVLMEQGQWEAAAEAFAANIAGGRVEFLSRFYRGLCLLRLNRPENASADFVACLLIRPSSQAARYNLAVSLQQAGKPNQGMQEISRLIAEAGERPQWMLLRANLFLAMGDQNAADSDRQRAIACKPLAAADWTSRGIVLLATDPDAAMNDFRQALRIAPDDVVALQNCAHVLAERLHCETEAIEYMDRLVRRQPKNVLHRAARCVLLARVGRLDDAITDIESIDTRLAPAIANLQAAGAFAILSQQVPGYSEDAIARLRIALKTDPSLCSIAINDPDLVAIRDTADFKTLIDAAQKLLK